MAGAINLWILGSGGAVPSMERLTPAILVRDWNGAALLMDAGEGVQLRLGRAGVSPSGIDVLLLTHEHGDHVNGAAGLLMSMSLQGRRRPLTVAGPKAAVEFIADVLEATGQRLGFEVNPVVLRGGETLVVYRRGGDELRVTSFRACHTVEALGYRLDWSLRPRIDKGRMERLGLKPGPWLQRLLESGEAHVSGRRVKLSELAAAPGAQASIAYTGDTAPCRSVEEAVRGVDVLLHDATFDSSLEEEASARGHSTARQAALIASRAGARILVLVHISQRYRGYEARILLREARQAHPRVLLAWDGASLTLRPRPSRPTGLSRARGANQNTRRLD